MNFRLVICDVITILLYLITVPELKFIIAPHRSFIQLYQLYGFLP